MRHPTLLACLAAASLALPATSPAQDPKMSAPTAALPFPGELTNGTFKDAEKELLQKFDFVKKIIPLIEKHHGGK